MDYRARFYDPTIGRFIQPDTIIPDLANSQNFNRYAYANNNPMLYNDPSGHVIQGRCNYLKNYKCDAPRVMTAGGGKPDWENARKIGYSEWEINALQRLYANGGILAMNGVDYILTNHVHILTGRSLLPNTGAWFDENSNTVTLNSDPIYYRADGSLTNYSLSLVIHEARHLEQGSQISHSKIGEWSAWQIQADVLQSFRDTVPDFRDVQPWEADVHGAGTLDKFVVAVKKYEPLYWNRAAGTPFCIGLCMYPDLPDFCDSLVPCGYVKPWWADLHPIP